MKKVTGISSQDLSELLLIGICLLQTGILLILLIL